ncbi:MAG: hypothetical protein IKY70_06615 [Bacteroidales bacterium]|nr:hypothetical protein [Bacteroidales bacterium]
MCRVLYLILFVLLSGIGDSLYAQTPAVKTTGLSKDSILIGDQVVWNTIFDVAEKDSVFIMPYANLLQTDTTGTKVEVIADFKLDTVAIRKGMKELGAKVLITSFDSGYYKLPLPLIVINPENNGGDTLKFETPFIAVNTIQVDTTGFVPMDIKGQIKYPVTFKEVLPWILLGLLVTGLAYLVYRYIKYRRENRDFFGRPIVQDPPHIVALRELDKIHSLKLWQNGKEKQFYTGITDTLRSYIEGRYGVSAMEKTSSEIMASLSDASIEERALRELDELFKVADLVKFAKYVPTAGENEEAIPVAVRFVNSTYMKELEEEKEGK